MAYSLYSLSSPEKGGGGLLQTGSLFKRGVLNRGFTVE